MSRPFEPIRYRRTDQRAGHSCRFAKRWLGAALVVFILGGASPATSDTGGVTDLPLPRFASLRDDVVNLRFGPGMEYPVKWVYVRRGLPVEVTAEYDNWRRIREIDGTTGGILRSLLIGQRTVLVAGNVRTLYDEPNTASHAVLRAEPHVLGLLRSCAGAWCRVEIGETKAYIERTHIWGVYAGETIP